MKTIIVGAGEVGLNIARHLTQENHNVVIIDNDPRRLKRVNETVDVQTILGMGCHPDILEQSGAETADMLIAVTKSDEINMVACQMGYSLFNIPTKIARVRHPAYLELTAGHLFTPDNMPVDVIISPEVEVADSVMRTISLPAAFDVKEFAQGQILMVGVRIDADSPVINVPLQDLAKAGQSEFVVMAIFRDDRIITPVGVDHMEEGDEIYFICLGKDIHDIMSLLGYEARQHIRRAMIIGGGSTGEEICSRFEQAGIATKLFVEEIARANYLADTLNHTTVIHGTGLDREILQEENIADMDMVLAVTPNDEENLLSSVMARDLGVENIVTRINRVDYMHFSESLGLKKILSPLEITASRILQYVRRGHIYGLHAIHQGSAQVFEVLVHKESEVEGQQISAIELPEGVTIGAIYSEKSGVILPRHTTVINRGDRVILFSTVEKLSEVEELF